MNKKEINKKMNPVVVEQTPNYYNSVLIGNLLLWDTDRAGY